MSKTINLDEALQLAACDQIFEAWWKLLPTGAYPEENKELFRHAYIMGWKDRNSWRGGKR